jgi:cytochrome c553
MSALFATSHSSLAADQPNGEELARQCSACHGKNGMAVDPESSNLAGQPSLYLEKALKDYKTGARQDRRMSLIAQGLNDDDIKALAAWYASFTVEVTRPE